MPFIGEIAKLRSLAIVGTAKNVGKTESLNYVLRRLSTDAPHLNIALTSIGIDGERRDQVTQTDKPEISLQEGMRFITAEKFFRNKLLPAEVLGIDRMYTTSMGRMIYAKARGIGKVLIAGPSSTGGLRRVVAKMEREGVDLTIIDGALSRLSLASPSVAEGMLLATGAAYSVQPEQLLRRMRELMTLISLPQCNDRRIVELLDDVDQGVRVVSPDGNVWDPGFASALSADMWLDTKWLSSGHMLYVAGVVSDRLLDRLRTIDQHSTLIVKDFTRIFASGNSVQTYLSSGREILSLYKTKLVGVTFNPVAPSGFRLDSETMCRRLSDALSVPVYDVKRIV